MQGPGWEAFHALVFTATVILVQAGHLAPGERIAASVALAAMIPWYLFVGRPLFPVPNRELGLRGPVYLTGMIALFAVAQHANPNAWFLAFAISPQCFELTTSRRAMGFIVAFNGIAALMIIVDAPTAANIASAVAIMIFATAFSVVYSRWTIRVIEQSEERAVLIAQLESAQAELAAAYHEAGVLAERQRLAAEIHDTLAQGFLSIVTLVQAAQADGSVPPGADEYLDLALATARENLSEARGLVTALAPAGLDTGLIGAVARAASATAKATGLVAVCTAEGDRRPLPTATEVVLLRVCQESLANVRKHAVATTVDVCLRYAPGTVQLTVTDDGQGFAVGPDGAPTAPAGTAFGLRSMGERLRQAGGTLTVTSAPGAGTVIRAEIPT